MLWSRIEAARLIGNPTLVNSDRMFAGEFGAVESASQIYGSKLAPPIRSKNVLNVFATKKNAPRFGRAFRISKWRRRIRYCP